jgi:alpha-L-rhamnosidase
MLQQCHPQLLRLARLLPVDKTSKETSMKYFSYAKPVFPNGMETDMNRFIGFRAVFKTPDEGHIWLRITGSSIYRVQLNGQFIAHGPARGPHGYFRVDEIMLPDDLFLKTSGKVNLLTVELASYNVNSFYLLDQPGFLQAEAVTDRGELLAATGSVENGFTAYNLSYRIQKVPRYSFQRTFSEVYRLNGTSLSWLGDSSTCALPELPCKVFSEKQLLPRRIAFPDYALRQPTAIVATGTTEPFTSTQPLWKDRSFVHIEPPRFKGFQETELEAAPSLEIQKYRSHLEAVDSLYDPAKSISFPSQTCYILDFGGDYSGFIGFSVTVHEPTKLLVSFDEILTENDINFRRIASIQMIAYDLAPGKYLLECIEPYTVRYLKFQTLSGNCSICNVYLREYCNPDVKATFACSDPELNLLYTAGVETFRQNVVDIPMDCPSRERAGWLCDSFFISRAALDLTGHFRVEKNFLENYWLAPPLPQLPPEMIPMCYPSDHTDGSFIPQWAMWFILQLEEYQNRSGDRQLIETLAPKVRSLLKWFARCRNRDGLLENIPGNNFVEWSAANDYIKDVNYPTNMLYAGTLRAADRLYHLPELRHEADMLAMTINRQSFDGQFFVDNAVRSADGVLTPTHNRTEICQYYAFSFDIATPKSHPDLWRILTTQFGPKRRENNPYPDVHFPNAFIGNYLRMEVLSRYGLSQQVLSEMQAYFVPMAKKTRTLWEFMTDQAGCDHGYASHVVRWLFRDAGGILNIDRKEKIVTLGVPATDISWCQAKMPLADGILEFEWERKKNGEVDYHLELPIGYKTVMAGDFRRKL